MKKLIFYPFFENNQVLAEFVYRATWYLQPLEENLSEILFFSDVYQGHLPAPESHLDQSLHEKYSNFKKIKISKTKSFHTELESADYVFVWDESKRQELVSLQKKFGFEFIRVDHKNVQHADSFFLRFAEKIDGLQKSFVERYSAGGKKILRSLKKEKCYLFGTGPNFDLAKNLDFSDGVVIACNSMVANSDVIENLDPDLFVIADPIFHAGPSAYAESFRSSLIDVMKSRETPLFVPLRDFHIYKKHLPEWLVDRITPVPFVAGSSPNLDLCEKLEVTTTSNILTLFQIPLAASISKEISISGCDGRPLTENKYFWSHSKSVQINDKMDVIKQAHPSFFAISYDDYYSKHVETLDSWIQACEERNVKVQNLTPSFIPALQQRTTDTCLRLMAELRRPCRPCRASIIIPLYNNVDYIEEAVLSLLSESIDNLEIIIVDDFSDDGGFNKAKELAHLHKNILAIQNFYRKGVSGARNTGLKIARGNVVGFLDSDDFIHPGSLRARIEKLESEDGPSVVHGQLEFVDPTGKSLGIKVGTARKITFKDAVGNPASFNTLMFKREALRHLTFDESLANGEDWLAFAKILRLGFESHFVPEGGAVYRVHQNSTVIKNMDKHEESLNKVIDWVTSPVSDRDAVQAYKQGLANVSRDHLYFGRQRNRLIWAILSGDLDAVKSIYSNHEFLAWLGKQQEIGRGLLVSCVRYFVVPVDNITKVSFADKAKILKTIEGIGHIQQLAILIDELKNTLDISDCFVDVAKANKEFCLGNYENALVFYEFLLGKEKFYKFLEFNVTLSKKRLKAA